MSISSSKKNLLSCWGYLFNQKRVCNCKREKPILTPGTYAKTRFGGVYLKPQHWRNRVRSTPGAPWQYNLLCASRGPSERQYIKQRHMGSEKCHLRLTSDLHTDVHMHICVLPCRIYIYLHTHTHLFIG